MARRRIPGAVFVVVSGGAVMLARGYGAAQLEPWRSVDPGRTVFRMASVTKVITATAALQLVERGRLELTQDVNAYLTSFHVQPFGKTPVTLHHLLTHTAGFDERLIGIAARRAADIQPLRAYLADSMPPRFAEAGQVTSYSNHGITLAGLLVEEAAGRPFADYVREMVLEPLEMRHSGFLTGAPPADMATAYEFVGGRHRPLSPEYLQTPPAGSFFTTGTDMARFLMAHLRGGTHQGRQILRSDTVARMHARQFTEHPGVSGWGYGLWEDARTGERALLHNGGGKGYRSLIYLLPGRGIAFFVAYNLADKHPDGELLEVLIERLRRTFVDRLERTARATYAHKPLDHFIGDFRYVRRARTTVERMISVPNVARIDKTPAGELLMTRHGDKPTVLRPAGPLLFRRDDDRGHVAFSAVTSGIPQRLIVDSGFPMVYERISTFATLRVQTVWLLAMALVFIYAGVWRPVSRTVRGVSPEPAAALRWSLWLTGVASGLNLIFLVAFPIAFFGDMEGGMPDFVYGTPAAARALLTVPPTTSVLALAAAIVLIAVWRNPGCRLRTRLEHTAVATTLLSFVAFARYWRFVG
jgi:CubicO group peptidase (beta-lactamase class C family)